MTCEGYKIPELCKLIPATLHQSFHKLKQDGDEKALFIKAWSTLLVLEVLEVLDFNGMEWHGIYFMVLSAM